MKCNPTLLGYDFARETLDRMGYDYIVFGRFHFEDDLQYKDAVPMLTRLMAAAEEEGLTFGVKLTNTFPVDVTRQELPSKEMYMSGRSLYALTISLAAKLSKDFGGKLRIAMLYAKALRSPYPRCLVQKIDTSKAKAHPDCVAVFTAKDVPNNVGGHIVPDYPPMIAEGEETRYIGDALALVVTNRKETLDEVLKLIDLTVEERKPVTSPEEALAEGAPKIHPNGNLLTHEHLKRGDADKSLREECTHTIHRKFIVPFTDHDQEVLWKAIRDGVIDTVSTDHCSFNWKQRQLGRDDFTKIPGGLAGVETRGNLIWSEGVAKGRISAECACRVLSENPAKLYGLWPKKGTLKPGSDADIVVIDPKKDRTVTAEGQVTNIDYNVYEGTKLQGSIDRVYLRGNLCTDGGKLIRRGLGRFVKRGLPQYEHREGLK